MPVLDVTNVLPTRTGSDLIKANRRSVSPADRQRFHQLGPSRNSSETKLRSGVKEPVVAHERRPAPRTDILRKTPEVAHTQGIRRSSSAKAAPQQEDRPIELTQPLSPSSTSTPQPFMELVRSVRSAAESNRSGSPPRCSIFKRTLANASSNPSSTLSAPCLAPSASVLSLTTPSASDFSQLSSPQTKLDLPSLSSIVKASRDNARARKVERSRSPTPEKFGVLDLRAGTPPLGVQQRELGMRLMERQKSWGSLEQSWLVKNAFATWRSVLRHKVARNGKMDGTLQNSIPSPQTEYTPSSLDFKSDFDTFSELQRVIAAKDKLIRDLEERIAEVMKSEPKLRRHSACLSANGVLDLQRPPSRLLLRYCFAMFQQSVAINQLGRQINLLEQQLAVSENRRYEVDQLLVRSEEELRFQRDQLEQRLFEVHTAEERRPTAARAISLAVFSAAASGRARVLIGLVFRAWASGAQRLPAQRLRLTLFYAKLNSRDMFNRIFGMMMAWQLYACCNQRHRRKLYCATSNLCNLSKMHMLSLVFTSWTQVFMEARFRLLQVETLAQTEASKEQLLAQAKAQFRSQQVESLNKKIDSQTYLCRLILSSIVMSWSRLANHTHKTLRRVASTSSTKHRQLLVISMETWVACWRNARNLYNARSFAYRHSRLQIQALLSSILSCWVQTSRDTHYETMFRSSLQQISTTMQHRFLSITDSLEHRGQVMLLIYDILHNWMFVTTRNKYSIRLARSLEESNIRVWLSALLAGWYHALLIARSRYAMDVASRDLAGRLHIWGTDVADRLTFRVQQRALLVKICVAWLRAIEDSRISDKVAYVFRWGRTRLWVCALLAEWQRAHIGARWTRATETAFQDLALKLHSRGSDIAAALARRFQYHRLLGDVLRRWSQFRQLSILEGKATGVLAWAHEGRWMAAIFAEWQRIQCLEKSMRVLQADLHTFFLKLHDRGVHIANALVGLLSVEPALVATFQEWHDLCKQQREHFRGVRIAEGLVNMRNAISIQEEVFRIWFGWQAFSRQQRQRSRRIRSADGVFISRNDMSSQEDIFRICRCWHAFSRQQRQRCRVIRMADSLISAQNFMSLAQVLLPWHRLVMDARWSSCTEQAVHEGVDMALERTTSVSYLLLHRAHSRVLLTRTFAMWYFYKMEVHGIRRNANSFTDRRQLVSTEVLRMTCFSSWMHSYHLQAKGRRREAVLRARCKDHVLSMFVIAAWQYAVDAFAWSVATEAACKELASKVHGRDAGVALALAGMGTSRFICSTCFAHWFRLQQLARLGTQREVVSERCWQVASTEALQRLMHVAMILWSKCARLKCILIDRSALRESFLETCCLIDVMCSWRIWSKTMLWMRKQQEMAGLLAQAGAQLVQASAQEVQRGRTENSSRRVIEHAKGQILHLLWVCTVGLSFAAWSKNASRLRQQKRIVSAENQEQRERRLEYQTSRAKGLVAYISAVLVDLKILLTIRSVFAGWLSSTIHASLARVEEGFHREKLKLEVTRHEAISIGATATMRSQRCILTWAVFAAWRSFWFSIIYLKSYGQANSQLVRRWVHSAIYTITDSEALRFSLEVLLRWAYVINKSKVDGRILSLVEGQLRTSNAVLQPEGPQCVHQPSLHNTALHSHRSSSSLANSASAPVVGGSLLVAAGTDMRQRFAKTGSPGPPRVPRISLENLATRLPCAQNEPHRIEPLFHQAHGEATLEFRGLRAPLGAGLRGMDDIATTIKSSSGQMMLPVPQVDIRDSLITQRTSTPDSSRTMRPAGMEEFTPRVLANAGSSPRQLSARQCFRYGPAPFSQDLDLSRSAPSGLETRPCMVTQPVELVSPLTPQVLVQQHATVATQS